jgi:hypothetical protein
VYTFGARMMPTHAPHLTVRLRRYRSALPSNREGIVPIALSLRRTSSHNQYRRKERSLINSPPVLITTSGLLDFRVCACSRQNTSATSF